MKSLLPELETRVRHDLACLNYPAPNWVPPIESVLDVLIVGAGMCGQTAAYATRREGVRNLRIIDRAPLGREGPWGTFARMQTLRSPKHLTGPDLGIPSLTFRAWYEAQHGEPGWAQLYKVARLDWHDYLLWVRRMVGVAVENGTSLESLTPDGSLLSAQLRHSDGSVEQVRARKVVLALGRDGSGALRWPKLPSFDPSQRAGKVFHSADEIDFSVFKAKRVAVLGAGSSAFDNAGTALEAGAAAVAMFVRRPILPQVNKSKWASFPGFFNGFFALSDEQRWAYFTYIFSEQVPPPFESVLRCDQHENFALHLEAGWEDLRVEANGVTVTTRHGEQQFDAAIIATGFDVDLMARDEMQAFRGDVLTWSHRVSVEQAAQFPEEARFPYLADGFQLIERAPDACPAARNLHIFNWGCTMSHGQLAGDVPGLATGALRLARALAGDLFAMSQDTLFAALLEHDEAELKPTRYYVAPR